RRLDRAGDRGLRKLEAVARADRGLPVRRHHRAAAEPAGRGLENPGRILVDVPLSDNDHRAGDHVVRTRSREPERARLARPEFPRRSLGRRQPKAPGRGKATGPTPNQREKRMLRRTLLTTAAAGFGLAFAGGAMAGDPMDKVKACFVYVGPIGDGGWTFQHHDGAMQVQAAYGDKVELQWQENVPEGADAERVLTQMALGGCNIIFTTSFGYMDPTNAVAAKFPNV